MSNSTYHSITLIIAVFLVVFQWNITSPMADWTDVAVPIQVTTAAKESHNDRGLHRIVRVSGTTIALGDGVNNVPYHEGVYRSTDNGAHWSQILDLNYATRGAIVTGSGEMVYVFWMSVEVNPGIYLSKFHYDATPPAPARIYTGYVTSVGGEYQTISPAVDANGNIYVVCHFAPSAGEYDRIWLLKSTDGGNTWSTPSVVDYLDGTSWTYPSLVVDHAGNLVVCYAEHAAAYLGGRADADKRIYFRKSTDGGVTWGSRIRVDNPAGPFGVYNPCMIEDQSNNLYIFAQRAQAGLVMAKSTDGGATWPGGFSVKVSTGDYADPSAAVGSDGTLYVTIRKDNECGAGALSWRNCMYQSTNGGVGWTQVAVYCGQSRVGPSGSVRYANWWNYGGPLEWCWEQYLSSNDNIRPVYYNINTDVSIWDRMQRPTRLGIDKTIKDYKSNPTQQNLNQVLQFIDDYMLGF
jgi:hypothetical protein